MPKRPNTTRSQADDSAITIPGQPRARRTRVTSAPGDTGNIDTQGARGTVTGERPIELDPERAPEAARALLTVGSGPNEDDIRLRAYHRFLERGGGHGMAFDDWLEAERELKLRG
jgi:Protein of unknown function (DUF2934)